MSVTFFGATFSRFAFWARQCGQYVAKTSTRTSTNRSGFVLPFVVGRSNFIWSSGVHLDLLTRNTSRKWTLIGPLTAVVRVQSRTKFSFLLAFYRWSTFSRPRSSILRHFSDLFCVVCRSLFAAAYRIVRNAHLPRKAG